MAKLPRTPAQKELLRLWACSPKGQLSRNRAKLRQCDPHLTPDEMDSWIERKRLGPCEVCGATEKLAFDHNHSTQKMRGILCVTCNAALGFVKESTRVLSGLAHYLRQHTPKTPMKPLVEVVWRDAQDSGEPWTAAEDVEKFSKEDCIIRSLGFLLSKTDKYLTLAADWHPEEGDYGRLTKIPCGMVVDITDLAVDSEEKEP